MKTLKQGSGFVDHYDNLNKNPILSNFDNVWFWLNWGEEYKKLLDKLETNWVISDLTDFIYKAFRMYIKFPEENLDRFCFFLDLAYGYNDYISLSRKVGKVNCYGSHSNNILGAPPTGSRWKKAGFAEEVLKRAFFALCQNLFKQENLSFYLSNPKSKKLLDKILLFFSYSENTPPNPELVFVRKSSDKNNYFIARDFLIRLCSIAWPEKDEYVKNKNFAVTLINRRKELIYVLYYLKKLDFLVERWEKA